MGTNQCAVLGCGFTRQQHPRVKCKKFIAPKQDNIPLSCPWDCGKAVYRADLERHAINRHGQKPVPAKTVAYADQGEFAV